MKWIVSITTSMAVGLVAVATLSAQATEGSGTQSSTQGRTSATSGADAKSVTVTGCLQREAAGGAPTANPSGGAASSASQRFVLANAKMGSGASAGASAAPSAAQSGAGSSSQ